MAQGRASGQSFTQDLLKVKEGLDKITPIFMSKIATEVIRLSPVLSGRYIQSHTIQADVRSPGGKFTRGKLRSAPASQNPQAERETALASLLAQAESLSGDTPVVVISNSVPHAYKVEYAGWGSTPPYLVYQTAKSRSSQFLQEAKVEAGLS